MSSIFSEDSYEQALISLYKELGYEYLYGPEIERDLKEPLLEDKVFESLKAINPSLPASAIEEAIKKIKSIEGSSLIETNYRFTLLMQNGVETTYVNNKKEHKTDIVRLIDYDHPELNTFSVVNQYTVQEYDVKRADIVIFINGIPLIVVELKSPSREETDASDAYLQLRNYMQVLPKLFQYNAFSVMSDMADTKVGTITSNEDRFMEWKQPGGALADYDTAFREIFTPTVLVNVLKNYILFNEKDGIGSVKILAGYHQYYAVEKAANKAVDAVKGDGKIGVFWHTQGSGKSLSMVFLAHHPKLQSLNPTIIVITDRNDLDDQLFGQFSGNTSFLRQKPKQATSRDDLRELLEGRHSGGIIFTTMQKFDAYDDALSDRRNIIVMTDEAHRGQYGLEEKIDEEGKTHIGTARKIRNSLPHASFIGFTGTPISDKDRDTQEIFGDYIDVYDMTQAVDDGATMPVYYESRVIKLQLNEEVLQKIDDEYDNLRDEGASEEDLEKNKKEMAHMDALLGNDQTVDALVNDVIDHYESNRQYVCGGKAMLVAYSRPIAMKIYNKILELRPAWTEKVKVVMTSGNQDPEEWQKVIGTKAYKNELARQFKDVNSEMKIAIVVDMWLTGFDVPSLSTMYVYKPMKGHNLMQAIARVNRVFPEKAGGLIVDYVGIASALKAAMNTYTKRDKSNFGNNDIRKTALIKFQEHLEICRDQLHGFDYSGFFDGKEAERALLIKGGVNFLIAVEKEEQKKEFVKNASLLGQSVTLCRSLLNQNQRIEAAFIETVRTLISRLSHKGPITPKQINERIAALIEQSVKSEGVVNLFNAKTEFSLFDEKFMEEIKQMKEKNIAVELLKRLLQGRVRGFQRTNVVKSEQFSDLLSDTLSRYLKGLITNEEVIQELLKLAKAITDSEDEGEKLGLSKEEKAFYDALTKPQAVKDFYQNEELIALTRELTETLRKNRTIDWNRRDSARANMRRIVKRMLRKYHYPPEDAEGAMETVLHQCEQWAENNDVDQEAGPTRVFID
jgi:type I restriction enzyme, R subunit